MRLKSLLPLSIALCITSITTFAQDKSYDIGLYLGGVNYYGEIGKKNFVAPNRAFLGIIGKMNFNEKLREEKFIKNYFNSYASISNSWIINSYGFCNVHIME